MALASNVTLTFNADLNIGDYFILKGSNVGIIGSEDVLFWETWVALRNAPNKVTKGEPTETPGERTAINYVEAFNLDFNQFGFTVARVANVVTIYSQPGITLGWAGFNVGEHAGSANTYTDITVEYTDSSALAINVTDFTFEQASSDFCSKVKVNITTDVLAVKVLSPVSINSNTNNPFSFEWLRGESIIVRVENSTGVQGTRTIALPSLLNPSNFDLTIINSPNGGTVIINNTNTTGLDLEYSLDGLDWQIENTFSGLPVGGYTLYVRDQLGCSFTKTFSVSEFGVNTPYFYISKANSFRFANRITWGDSENYKNDENTLSCEVDALIPYQEVQQFQSADIIATQFLSNYDSNRAFVVKQDGTEIEIPVLKKTQNIEIQDRRDARKYNLGNGRTGIYFISGNIYNYVSGGIIGTYALNGLLPEWGTVGNYITIDNAWFLIEDIIFDESRNADVIVFSEEYIGPEVNVIVGSIFNRFNYEAYEFEIDMVNYIDQYFRIKIVCSDPNYTTITQLSELQWVKVKHDNVLEIRYRNTTNTDVIFSTGIEFKIRIPYTYIKGKLSEDSETHKTDTTSILLTADLYEVDDFVFEPVTKELWRKITQALSHEIVTINGVGYVKNGEFNTEGPMEETNLYVLTATMIKTGNVYSSQTAGNMDFDGSQVEVPGLIETDSGYVRY